MLYQLSYLGVLQERGQSPSSGRVIVGSERPVHPRFAWGVAGAAWLCTSRGGLPRLAPGAVEIHSNI